MAWEDKTLILAMILSAGFAFWPGQWKSKPVEAEFYPFVWISGILFFFRTSFGLSDATVFIIIGTYFFISLRVLLICKDEDKKSLVAYFLGWLIPGCGYLFIGKKDKAIFFFCAILVVLVIGLLLTSFKPVGWEDNPFYYLGRFGCGVLYLLFEVMSPLKAEPVAGLSLALFDTGLLYCCLAGILNLTISLSVLTPKQPKLLEDVDGILK